MKKSRKMSEKSRFVASLIFTAVSAVSAVFLVIALILSRSSGSVGGGGVIAFYAIYGLKKVAACFLSVVTFFYALIAVAFSVMTVGDNAGKVRRYGIILTAASAALAVFGAAAFCINLAQLFNS